MILTTLAFQKLIVSRIEIRFKLLKFLIRLDFVKLYLMSPTITYCDYYDPCAQNVLNWYSSDKSFKGILSVK